MQEIVSKLQISEVILIFLFLIEEWQLWLTSKVWGARQKVLSICIRKILNPLHLLIVL